MTKYTITINARPQHIGGYRVACFSMPTDDWNARAVYMAETRCRTFSGAERIAREWAKRWGAEIVR